MFLTHTSKIRGLSKLEYSMLREMCRYSNNLYNVALYSIRQYFFREKQFLSYTRNYHECKTNENYGLLQAGVAQQILKITDRSFKSFFNLIKKAKTGSYSFKDIKIPHYREKGGMFNLILSTNAINIKNGFLFVPMSHEFSSIHENAQIKIPFPERLKDKNIKEVRIIPVHNGRFFKIQYCYKQSIEDLKLNKSNILSIDIGLDNLASCVTTIGTSFIMDGRKLKSINHHWNKRKAHLQAIAMRQGQHTTKLIQNITLKRNNRVDDYIKKVARYIVNYCILHDIGTVICGYNFNFKRKIDLGKKNNQNFVQISLGNLRQSLAGLCERYSMQYFEQEESYTSRASFLDLDSIPVYNPKQPFGGDFSGKRIKRGLYRFSNNQFANADINGAANILRKSKQNFDYERLCKGLLASPLRIREPFKVETQIQTSHNNSLPLSIGSMSK